MGASESKDFRRAEKRLRNGKRAASVVEYWSMAPVLASDMGVATTTKFTESDLDTAARAINWAVEAIPAAVGSELLADDCARLFGSARFCDVLECNGEERWLELRSRLVEQLGQVGITLLAKINQERELAELAGSQMAQAQRVIQEVDLSFSQPAAGRRSGKVAASRELLLARALAPVVSLEAQRILWFVNHGEIAVGQTSTIGSVRIKGNALIQIGVASFSAVHSRRLVNGLEARFGELDALISLPALLTPGEPAEGFHVVSGFVRFDYNTETSPAAIAKLPATSRIWQELRQVVAAESTQSAELFDAIVEELRADEASRVTVPVAVQIQVRRSIRTVYSIAAARDPSELYHRCTDRGVVGLFGAPSNTMQGGWWYPRPSVDVLRRNSVCVDVDAETGKHIEDDRVVAAELHRLRTRVDPIKLIMGHDRDHSDVASYYEAAAIDL